MEWYRGSTATLFKHILKNSLLVSVLNYLHSKKINELFVSSTHPRTVFPTRVSMYYSKAQKWYLKAPCH